MALAKGVCWAANIPIKTFHILNIYFKMYIYHLTVKPLTNGLKVELKKNLKH